MSWLEQVKQNALKYQLKRFVKCTFPAISVISTEWLIGLVGKVFANGPGDLSSIPDRVLPKTLKMVLNTSLLNT